MKIIILMIIFFVSGCAKLSYMTDQSGGYLGLLLKSKKNEEVLADKNIPEEYKEKIRLVIQYKDFFFNYFKEKKTGIYSQTTILEGNAVTYLVIASPVEKIQPLEFSFPFIGKFPYIGFFDKKKADKKEKELQVDGYVTFQRPVYAFSTLGYFEDRILSSFFNYDNFNLAELVFHELFHTIFFITDEVDLNENLANYFAEEMALEYFKTQPELIKKHELALKQQRILSRQMQKHTKEIEDGYAKIKNGKKEDYTKFFTDYIEQVLKPNFKDICQREKISKEACYPLRMEWNNAKLAAFKSYEKDQDFFEELHLELKISLLQYYQLLKNDYSEYNKNKKGHFTEYLSNKYFKTKVKK